MSMSPEYEYQNISIGRPYPFPMSGEGGRYSFDGINHDLALAFRNPRQGEIDAVQRGDVSIGLYVNRGLLWLLYHFGDGKYFGWAAAPYSWHVAPGAKDFQLSGR